MIGEGGDNVSCTRVTDRHIIKGEKRTMFEFRKEQFKKFRQNV